MRGEEGEVEEEEDEAVFSAVVGEGEGGDAVVALCVSIGRVLEGRGLIGGETVRISIESFLYYRERMPALRLHGA